MKTLFTEEVLAVVRTIPKGSTMTYGQVALKAGYLGAARAVGSIMKHNYDTTVPCHRVVKAYGTVGEYNRGGPNAKILLLKSEGAL